MPGLNQKDIDAFLHGQIACWNSGNREGFFEHYRQVAPKGLSIEYVGRPAADGWPVLEAMWDQQNSRFSVEVEVSILGSNEAACHHRNVMRDGSGSIETIELYRSIGSKIKGMEVTHRAQL